MSRPGSAPFRPPPPPRGTDVDLSALVAEMDLATRVAEVDADFTARTSAERQGRAVRFKIAVVATLASIVLYFVGNVYAQRSKFPDHFAWWDRQATLEAAAPPQGTHRFSMYQVATAAFHSSVQKVVNATTLWPALSQKGALFLMHCVTYFERTPRTRGKLGPLHWAGSGAQTGAGSLFRPVGAGWSSPCAVGDALADRKERLRRNWIASREHNIWYDFFPDPRTAADAFFGVHIFSQVLNMDCGSELVMNFDVYRLFDGGLCGIAHREQSKDESAMELFFRYFGVHSRAATMCYGLTEAAISGAAVGGTGALAMAEGFEHLDALKKGSGASLKFGAGVAAVSLMCGVAGAFAARASAQEDCDNAATDDLNASLGRV